MELILVVVISSGMAENSQNGVSRSLTIDPVTLVVVLVVNYSANRPIFVVCRTLPNRYCTKINMLIIIIINNTNDNHRKITVFYVAGYFIEIF